MIPVSRQIFVVTALLAVCILWLWFSGGSWMNLWLTADQQGRRALDALEFQAATELFEDSNWAAIAHYEAGTYAESATLFSRSVEAEAAYNRGNALMKARQYRQAIGAYEAAANAKPDWQEAADNLDLARYVTDYIERARESSDTGDESELSADGYEFDNRNNKGEQMTITNQSVMEAASAEKWMRSVNTETRDYLQMRFSLESAKQQASTRE